jgi:hypothetical protein
VLLRVISWIALLLVAYRPAFQQPAGRAMDGGTLRLNATRWHADIELWTLDFGLLFEPRAVGNFFGERSEHRLPFLPDRGCEKHALGFIAAHLAGFEV